MTALRDQAALVTGASSGIGAAIAESLATAGASVCLVARRGDELDRVLERVGGGPDRARAYRVDLTDDRQVRDLAASVEADLGRLDLLVHCAGTISLGSVAEAPVADLDAQYATNLRARYLLTQVALPMILASRGQVVFVNSSAGNRASGAGVGQYAATQHAQRAIADSLRAEVNARGVRVLSVFPGRTATPLQATVHELEGKDYEPERLVQPSDVASVVLHALTLPRTAEITEISIRPFVKPA
jgi:NADP-dependent 3-hydroxy acid dehydrogenase YdfG